MRYASLPLERMFPKLGVLYKHHSDTVFLLRNQPPLVCLEKDVLVVAVGCSSITYGGSSVTVCVDLLCHDGVVRHGEYLYNPSSISPCTWDTWWKEVE
jgi:hypothetical protein